MSSDLPGPLYRFASRVLRMVEKLECSINAVSGLAPAMSSTTPVDQNRFALPSKLWPDTGRLGSLMRSR